VAAAARSPGTTRRGPWRRTGGFLRTACPGSATRRDAVHRTQPGSRSSFPPLARLATLAHRIAGGHPPIRITLRATSRERRPVRALDPSAAAGSKARLAIELDETRAPRLELMARSL